MLTIHIPKTKLWDELNEEFILVDAQDLELEHSLVSISKWESKWHKSFFDKGEKSYEETIDYIKCMTLTPNGEPEVYLCFTADHMEAIHKYIEDPMTATTVPKDNNAKGSKERVTSELIYYWMISLQIPVEFENWHINRLITLIEVCGHKNSPPKKRGMRDIMRDNAARNAARRAKTGSRG